MANGTLTLQGTQTSVPSGAAVPLGPFSITMGPCDSSSEATLIIGHNVLAVPATANGAIIIPPAGFAGELTLKGADADTGTPISDTEVTLLRFNNAHVPASLIIDSDTAFATPPLTVRFF